MRHAVLSSEKLTYSIEQTSGGRQLCHLQLGSEITVTDLIPSILAFCIDHAINIVWVTPGCKWGICPTGALISAQLEGEWDILHTTASPKDAAPEEKCLKQVTARRKVGTWQEKKQIVITWPEYTSYQWRPEALPEVLDPIACLAGIHYEEKAYKMPLHPNAGIMGRQIMITTNSTGSRPEWIIAPTMDLSRLPTQVGYDLTYNSGVLDGDHVHSWDKDAAWLAAASHEVFGVGNPVYLGPRELQYYDQCMKKWWDGRRPGYWHINYREEDIPEISPFPRHIKQEWVTTPLLRLLFVIGFKFVITEAWVWPEYKKILDRFAKVVWDARVDHDTNTAAYPHAGGRKIARYSDKRIATSAVGLLGNKQAQELAPEWGRKDFLDTIIERNKEAVYMKVLQVKRLHGKKPFLINNDNVAYASDEANPELVFPNLFNNPGHLGGWKLLYSLPVTPQIKACFAPGLPGTTANRRLKQLLKAGGE